MIASIDKIAFAKWVGKNFNATTALAAALNFQHPDEWKQ